MHLLVIAVFLFFAPLLQAYVVLQPVEYMKWKADVLEFYLNPTGGTTILETEAKFVEVATYITSQEKVGLIVKYKGLTNKDCNDLTDGVVVVCLLADNEWPANCIKNTTTIPKGCVHSTSKGATPNAFQDAKIMLSQNFPSSSKWFIPIFLHEVGHVMAFDHEDSKPSIMSTVFSDASLRFSETDLEGLIQLYPEQCSILEMNKDLTLQIPYVELNGSAYSATIQLVFNEYGTATHFNILPGARVVPLVDAINCKQLVFEGTRFTFKASYNNILYRVWVEIQTGVLKITNVQILSM